MNPTKLIAITGAAALVITAGASTYQIQEGDTLSEIIYQKNLKPIYGKLGYLKKIIKLNKNVIRGNETFLRIGDYIELPDGVASAKTIVEVEKREEVHTTKTEEIVIPLPKKRVASKVINGPKPASLQQIPNNDQYPYSYFKLSPSFSSLKIDSINLSKFGGTDVTLLSRKGVGFDASWNIAYDEKRTYFGFASMEYYSLFNDPNYIFNHSTLTRFHFGIGAKAQCFSDFELTTKASVREVGFLDVVTPVNVNVSSISLTEFNVGAKQTFATKKNFAAKVGGHILGLLPGSVGSYHSKMGYGAGVLAELLHANKSMSLTYDYRTLKINEIKDTESTVALIMNFTIGETQ